MSILRLFGTPGTDTYYTSGLSFTVPDYLSDKNLNFYYEITDKEGGFIEGSQTLRIALNNNNPLLTGTKAVLADGLQNNNYTIIHDQLLQGFTDPDGDSLSVTSITANNGTLVHNNNGTCTFNSNKDFSAVDISYNVIDENGSIAASQSFNINAPFISPASKANFTRNYSLSNS